MSKIWGALIKVQVLIPFPTWCDCSRSLSHRGFSHSQIICCWTLSPRPMSAGVITINKKFTILQFFSFTLQTSQVEAYFTPYFSSSKSPPPVDIFKRRKRTREWIVHISPRFGKKFSKNNHWINNFLWELLAASELENLCYLITWYHCIQKDQVLLKHTFATTGWGM